MSALKEFVQKFPRQESATIPLAASVQQDKPLDEVFIVGGTLDDRFGIANWYRDAFGVRTKVVAVEELPEQLPVDATVFVLNPPLSDSDAYADALKLLLRIVRATPAEVSLHATKYVETYGLPELKSQLVRVLLDLLERQSGSAVLEGNQIAQALSSILLKPALVQMLNRMWASPSHVELDSASEARLLCALLKWTYTGDIDVKPAAAPITQVEETSAPLSFDDMERLANE